MLQVATYPFLYRSGFDSILYWLLKEPSPKAFFFLVAKHKSLKMNPEKRRSIESFFLSSNKKSRNDDQKTETNVTTSSPSSAYESKNPPATSPSNSDDQVMCDNASDTSSSSLSTSFSLNENFGKSVPKDISTSCHDPPAQPQLPNYPLNHQKRSFQSSWYKDRIWLEHSVLNDTCYCYFCRHFSANKLCSSDMFSTTAFNNWKKALERNAGLMKHVSSQSHIIATKNYESYREREKTNSNVLNKLDFSRSIQIRKNRDRLIKICSTLHLMTRQMISFRGHNESERYVEML